MAKPRAPLPKRASRTRKGHAPARRESSQEKRARSLEILKRLRVAHPDAKCSLDFESPFQLLIATILSAQCTDERVNKVTPELFRRYPTASDVARAPREEIESRIRSTGFFRNKAKSIQGACARIVDEYGGKIPRTMEELLTLPGVARKTANVVLGNAFGIASGVVVDTHVKRVAARLGLTKHTDPEKIERDLVEILPNEDWIDSAHLFILHGRRICVARKPRCEICPLNALCPSAGAPPIAPSA